MWVNVNNESLQVQWKSDFCMERYSFEKLVQILATVAAKKSTNFGKTITIQMPLDNFDRQMHSVQQLKHLLLESLHIFWLRKFFLWCYYASMIITCNFMSIPNTSSETAGLIERLKINNNSGLPKVSRSIDIY